MKTSTLVLLVLSTLPVTAATAQDATKSRADIANQRILAEAERRRQEELAAQKAAEETEQTPAAHAAPPPAAPVVESTMQETAPRAAEPARSRADLSVVMQQIRTLGELRDAGYVTADEFDRIKARILNDAL